MNEVRAVRRPRRTKPHRPNELFAAAAAEFAAKGFAATRIADVAQRVGLRSRGSVYRHFDSKEAMHRALLDDLLDIWLAPLRAMNPEGDPRAEIMGYMRRKLQMSRDFPRESRLFANEVLQGVPRLQEEISVDLKALVDDRAALIRRWIAAGKLAVVDPYHLIFSIWALTQHYADFDAQIRMIRGDRDPMHGAEGFLEGLFERLLQP